MNPPRVLFPCIVASSAALHAAVGFVMPERRALATQMAPSFVEIMDVAPPPPPEPEPAPDPPDTPAPAVRAPAPVNVDRVTTSTRRTPALTAAATNAAPIDFTGTLLSSADGPGVPLPAGREGAATSAAAPAAPVVRHGPETVSAHDLSKAPRPPPLDLVLERNYPADARRSGMPGTAILSVQILADGSVGVVRHVSQTSPRFGDACERAVRSGPWSAPLDRAGRPVATLITYTCRFEVKS